MLFIIIYHYLFLFLHRPLNTTCSVGYVNTFLSCTRITISSTDLYQTQTAATICGFFCSSAEMGVIQTIYNRLYVVVYIEGVSLLCIQRVSKRYPALSKTLNWFCILWLLQKQSPHEETLYLMALWSIKSTHRSIDDRDANALFDCRVITLNARLYCNITIIIGSAVIYSDRLEDFVLCEVNP